MILIADSGSSKTDWGLVGSDMPLFHTQGINPVHQGSDEILRIIYDELLSQMGGKIVTDVFFYGSGVRPELQSVMVGLLRKTFPMAKNVEAHSDLLGAARSLCARKEGIACILGTGANSCLYDGNHIVRHVPALGYILGDEGSGAVLGKRFLHALYMDLLPEGIKENFEAETGLDLPEIIARVYRQPMANRFLASLSEFVHRHLCVPAVRDMVIAHFSDFLRLHVAPYGRPDLPVSFTGSVTWYYREELCEAAAGQGFMIGSMCRTPLAGLLNYHGNM